MATITEDYVSFETAKLLKEKGFNEPTICVYHKDGTFEQVTLIAWNDKFITPISAPTLQMVMKWLVQEYRLYVNVVPSVVDFYWTKKWDSYVEDLNKRYPLGKFISTFNSLEEAAEAAIKYCLENLI